MNKQITIINQDSGYLMIDIANAFAEAGYQVSLITGRLLMRSTPLHKSVKLHRIVFYRRNSMPSRLFTWIFGFIQILFLILSKHRKSHLLIVSNPPFAPLLPLVLKNPFSLLIFDIFPDAVWNHGMAKSRTFWINWWKKTNQKVFSRALKIFTLTDSMRECLGKYVSKEKVEVVPIWSDSQFLKPIPHHENPFVKEHGLEGKFIVMYSGNIGLTHRVDVLPEIAARINDSRVVFLIIGDGAEKASLEKKVQSLGLTNCLLLPRLPVEELPYSMAAASLAVVSSGGGAANLSIPSKTYNFLSVGAPLLCLSPKGSELEKLVDKYKNGKCFTHDQMDEIAGYIHSLALDEELCKELSTRSVMAAGDYTPENAKRFLIE